MSKHELSFHENPNTYRCREKQLVYILSPGAKKSVASGVYVSRIRTSQTLYRIHGEFKRAREGLACAKRRAREAQVGVRGHSLSLTKILSNFAPDPHLRTNKRPVPFFPTTPAQTGE